MAEKENRELLPTNVKLSKKYSFGNISVEIMEINPIKHPFSNTTYNIAYRVIDTNINPPFISETAHIFGEARTNLMLEFSKIINHYKKIGSMLRAKP